MTKPFGPSTGFNSGQLTGILLATPHSLYTTQPRPSGQLCRRLGSLRIGVNDHKAGEAVVTECFEK